MQQVQRDQAGAKLSLSHPVIPRVPTYVRVRTAPDSPFQKRQRELEEAPKEGNENKGLE